MLNIWVKTRIFQPRKPIIMQILKDLCIETSPPEEVCFSYRKIYRDGVKHYFCHIYEVFMNQHFFIESMYSTSTDDLYKRVKEKYGHNRHLKERTTENFLDWYYKLNPNANGGISLQSLLLINKKFEK